MFHRLYRITLAASLLLAIPLLFVFVLSMSDPAIRLYDRVIGSQESCLVLYPGQVLYRRLTDIKPLSLGPNEDGRYAEITGWDAFGLHYHNRDTVAYSGIYRLPGTFGNTKEFAIDFTLPMLLCLALPAIHFSKKAYDRFQLQPEINAQKCSFCGYDIRASKERCPECGTHINHP